MPLKSAPVKVHPSWTFGDRLSAIERILGDIHVILERDEPEIGVATAALLFSLIGILSHASPENPLAVESKLVEVCGTRLLRELDTMYNRVTENEKKAAKHVH